MTEDNPEKNKEKSQSPARIVIHDLISFIMFLIILGFLNISLDFFDSNILAEVVKLLNNNIWLIFIFSIIFTIGEVFGSFRFPGNLPAPIFNAIGSIFLLNFLFKIFRLVGNLSEINTFDNLTKSFPFLYPITFLLVLLGGYISILSGSSWETPKKKKTSAKSTSKEKVSWDDVGNEFKEMLYEAFHSARESIKQNKK
jgi:flagellar biosynthesis protein FlhB